MDEEQEGNRGKSSRGGKDKRIETEGVTEKRGNTTEERKEDTSPSLGSPPLGHFPDPGTGH